MYKRQVPQEVIDEIEAFRASDEKLTMMGMAKEVRKMDGKSLSEERSWKTHPALKFMYWQKFCWDTENLPIGLLSSFSMEKRSKISSSIEYLFHRIGLDGFSPLTTDLVKAYDAPFPDNTYKMGPRAMPSQVPMIPDASLEAQRVAREFFATSNKPLLSVFAGNDPVTNGIEKDVLRMAPNARSAPHIGGGHFYQWTKPEKLSGMLADFIKE